MEKQRAWNPKGASKAAFSLVDEFRNFALKGNVIDLAVGVIIGGAFGKIVDSLVKHIIMPSVAMILPGEQGYVGWKFTVGEQEIPYGLFLGELVNFLIVALALFLFAVKFLGWISRLRKAEAVQEEAAPPAPTREEELLTEIRDLLAKQAR
jgi:large conductance mechanosensitive channel